MRCFLLLRFRIQFLTSLMIQFFCSGDNKLNQLSSPIDFSDSPRIPRLRSTFSLKMIVTLALRIQHMKVGSNRIRKTIATACQLRTQLRATTLAGKSMLEFLSQILAISDSLVSIGSPVMLQAHIDSILKANLNPSLLIKLRRLYWLMILNKFKQSSSDLPSINLTQVSNKQDPKSFYNFRGSSSRGGSYSGSFNCSGDGGASGRAGSGSGLGRGAGHFTNFQFQFWDSAFCTTVYLINRLPTTSLKFEIPYHVLFQKLPDYSFLKTFGCSCFPLLRPYNNHKLDFRSHECIFLGYSTSHKGYKCLSPSRRVYISKDVIFNDSKFPSADLFESSSLSIAEKPEGTDGAERELEEGIWESEGVEAETGGDSYSLINTRIHVLDEGLRAVSGFQGTEDLSDDKLMDIPFASDCIRMKKVSSAPSYELECKDDVIVNFESCGSGSQQWCEAIEKHMPLILCHSSAMVRAASVTCFAGMTSSVFICFSKEKQDFILSSLVHAAVHDNVPSVRSAACRAIGIISCFPQVCQSAEVLDKFIHAVEINTRDALISVRITASWALANICDAICHSDRILPYGQMGSNSNTQVIVSLSECALHLTKDGDKVKSNAVRALGYISRILKSSTSKFQGTSAGHHDRMTDAYLNSENLMVCQQNCASDSLQDLNRLERIVHAFISCITTGNVKVQWNVCHALGNLFLNETLRLQDMDWTPVVFGVLLQLLRNSSNFKIRIQAAAALAVPMSMQDYGLSFSEIVQSVEHVMENIDDDQISGPSNFKYRVSLQKQRLRLSGKQSAIAVITHLNIETQSFPSSYSLTLTMLHILRFTSSTNDQNLKDFLVKYLHERILLKILKVLSMLMNLSRQTPLYPYKCIADRKRVLISGALQSLIEVYKEKQQDAIAQKFEELKNNM
ncbi:hypothetical protein JHK87_015552 [Glycine soja]|nr:hypothetical protein JHK87_015552 [Glycine soja]